MCMLNLSVIHLSQIKLKKKSILIKKKDKLTDATFNVIPLLSAHCSDPYKGAKSDQYSAGEEYPPLDHQCLQQRPTLRGTHGRRRRHLVSLHHLVMYLGTINDIELRLLYSLNRGWSTSVTFPERKVATCGRRLSPA